MEHDPTAIPPKEAFVYREDIVKCKKNADFLGLVMEVAGDADSDGSITEGSDNEEDEVKSSKGGGDDGNGGDDNGDTIGDDNHDSLPDGQLRVSWTDGSQTTEHIDSVVVVDRGFLHGDIVSSAANPTGQLGLVVDVSIMVDLQDANGNMIRGVSSRDLKRIREFSVGDFVVCGPWLGRVDEVLDNVTVLFDDGSLCKVVRADPLRLQPASLPIMNDANCPYYPGQRVRAVSSSVFKSSRWLSGLWKASRLEGTVTKVETVAVVVYWVASAHFSTTQASVPPEEQNPKNLTLLSSFSHANWQMFDRCLLPLPPNYVVDTSMESVEPKESCLEEHTDNKGTSCLEGSEQSLDVPMLETNIQNKRTGSNDQLYSKHGGDDYRENLEISKDLNRSSELGENSYGVLNKSSELGENKGDEANALPESSSCCSSASVSKEPANENYPTYRKKLRKVFFKRDKKVRRRDETFERALLIANTITKVDVAWQDGTREYGITSTSLIPIHSPNDHEFFPDQYVVEKASSEVEDYSSVRKRVGIVRSVNAKEKTVSVRWLKAVSRPEEPKEYDIDEVVSAYELDGHPDYDYCYGDVVVRLPSISHSTRMDNREALVSKPDGQADSVEAGATFTKMNISGQVEQVPEDESSVNFTSLSWVGNIIGFQDGDIEVMWGDGTVSTVGPHEIYVVVREGDGDSFDGGSEVSDDGASWETVDDNEGETVDGSAQEYDSQDLIEDTADTENNIANVEEVNNGRNGPLSMPLAAIGYVTRLATEFFTRGRKQSHLSGLDSIDETEPEGASEASEKASNLEAHHEGSDVFDSAAHIGETTKDSNHSTEIGNSNEKVNNQIDSLTSVKMDVGATEAGSGIHLLKFKHFDIVQNPSDHHFLEGNGKDIGGRKWVKKVQHEWSILQKNLPDAVYVRVFEDRMDLIRAVIVGASGTPYQDGLFFFDFHLPPEYPQVPPSAYYHSGGLRVNPNLYVDGKVCLSLLNTWTGKGNEVWDPSSSSLLQVLVSLQGLVLNSKPYFNEAGYEKQVGTVEGEKNSLPYNESTYLLNLKSMLYLLKRSPLHFKDFVKDHFRRRGYYILKACEAYLEGAPIGSLTEDACPTEKSSEHSSSVGFKLALSKALPRLISALRDAGSACDQFEHLLKPES